MDQSVCLSIKHSGGIRRLLVTDTGLTDDDQNLEEFSQAPSYSSTIRYDFYQIDFCQSLLEMMHDDPDFRDGFLRKHAHLDVLLDLDATSPKAPLDYKS